MPAQNQRATAIVITGTLLIASALNGCAMPEKNNCLHADWFSIGYNDGAKGFKSSHISQHRQACDRYGVAPDFETYERGRRQGLTEWCTPRNGYVMGAAGRKYNGVCPKNLEPAYLEAYSQGEAVYAYQAQIGVRQQAVQKLRAELDAIDKDIAALETERSSHAVSPRGRNTLMVQIHRRKQDRRLLLRRISDAEQTVETMHRNLKRMKTQNPFP